MATVLVVALAAVPFITSDNTVLNWLAGVLIMALAAQGWNLLGGYGGQLSFGHAAFFGSGAYVTAVLQQSYGLNAWAGAAAGILAGMAAGGFIGAVSFRAGLRGSYFALVTLAFAEVFRILANALPITGEAAGILLKLDVRPWNFQFASRATFVYVALAAVTAALGVTYAVSRSRFGAQLAAVRENEESARALGIDPFAVKLRAMVISAGITAGAGVLYVQYDLFLNADLAFGAAVSVSALLAPVIGGLGTVSGPVLGALVLGGLSELVRRNAGPVPGLDQVLFGVLLVLAIAFAPGGVAGLRWRRRA